MTTEPEGRPAVHSDRGLAHESMSQVEVLAQSVAGIAPSAVIASSTVSENTEMQSSVRQAGTRPALEISPRLGFSPTMLLSPAGTRPDPAVSVPSAIGTIPAATATAEPELDPPGTSSRRSVLRGTP